MLVAAELTPGNARTHRAMTDVSVVIPARDAAERIERTLAAIADQDFGGGYEVIVVDDGSRDATALVAERAGARVVRNQTALGPAGARDAGVAVSTGGIIAFTDSDCAPDRGWLRAGFAACEHADLVQGRVEPDSGHPPGPFDHTISVRGESLLYETANLFVRREWFDRVGGFRAFIDPAEGHFGEDVLFAWSARRLGARPAFSADALVRHEVVARPASEWLRERRRLALFPELIRAVPELRERMPAGIFLSSRTALFDLALAALVVSVLSGRRWPLLAALPYARRSLRTRDPLTRAALHDNAALVAGDCVGFAALLRGSMRARTLVL
jgi:glycosyltransferase involved in cell wall biosynthesis